MQSVTLTHLSSASSPHDLHNDATCTIRTVPPLVLRADWKTLTRSASSRNKPLDLNVCPMPPSSSIGFVPQPTNRSPLDFEAQTNNPSRWFWCPNYQTVAIGFKAQTGKLEATGFEAKPGEIVDFSFDAKPRNSCYLSPCAWCKPLTTSHDLSVVWPPSIRHVLDHP
jgi:hypothetical protein